VGPTVNHCSAHGTWGHASDRCSNHTPLPQRPTSVACRSVSGCRNGPADTSSFPLCPDHRPGPTLVRCDHLSTAAQGIVGNAVSVSCPIGIFAVPRINTAGVVLESPIGGWQTNNQPANPQQQDEPETAHQDIAQEANAPRGVKLLCYPPQICFVFSHGMHSNRLTPTRRLRAVKDATKTLSN
jgi:hypothetical protein